MENQRVEYIKTDIRKREEYISNLKKNYSTKLEFHNNRLKELHKKLKEAQE